MKKIFIAIATIIALSGCEDVGNMAQDKLNDLKDKAVQVGIEEIRTNPEYAQVAELLDQGNETLETIKTMSLTELTDSVKGEELLGLIGGIYSCVESKTSETLAEAIFTESMNMYQISEDIQQVVLESKNLESNFVICAPSA